MREGRNDGEGEVKEEVENGNRVQGKRVIERRSGIDGEIKE